MIKYIKQHLFPFISALVFFLMDASGIIGPIGSYLYYPLLLFVSGYAIWKARKVNFLYVAFLLVCLVSIIINPIPDFFRIHLRYGVFVLIFLAFSGLLEGRELAFYRLYFYHFFTYLTLFLVILNVVLFQLGYISPEQMEYYEEKGMYTGSTGNNHMAVLTIIAISIITVVYIKFSNRMNLPMKVLLLVILILCIAMMALTASRMGLICTVTTIVLIIYREFHKKGKKLLWWGILAFIVILFVQQTMADMFLPMLDKNHGSTSEININSRESLWDDRIAEFKENPVWGIGFATAKYGVTNYTIEMGGRIETGSGWLTVLSQTGIIGTSILFFIILQNALYIYRKRKYSYTALWLLGMFTIFLIHPISEGYITTIGDDLCCLFWLNLSVMESLRKGYITENDLELS